MTRKKILFQLSGSIACYKACDAISKLVQRGHDVQVVATESALRFVGQATLEGLSGHPVLTDLWQAGRAMDHIHLIRDADLAVLAPATANRLNLLAAGLGNDLVSTLFLAHDFSKPYLIAPAMNHAMFAHPITQASIAKLKSFGCGWIEGQSGNLACGEVGVGRLAEPAELVAAIETALAPEPRKSQKILVTAGGTEEPIDAVRYIGNSSSGETGYLIANDFRAKGFEVHFLISEKSPYRLASKNFSYRSFADFERQLSELTKKNEYECIVFSAALSDFRVLRSSEAPFKISSQADTELSLIRNPKLINGIKAENAHVKLVGFKLHAHRSESERSIVRNHFFADSQCDFLVENDVAEWSRDGEHPFEIYQAAVPPVKIAEAKSKLELAKNLTNLIPHFIAERTL